jgi:hypothetical protein
MYVLFFRFYSCRTSRLIKPPRVTDRKEARGEHPEGLSQHHHAPAPYGDATTAPPEEPLRRGLLCHCCTCLLLWHKLSNPASSPDV